jgi:hypothetical protein
MTMKRYESAFSRRGRARAIAKFTLVKDRGRRECRELAAPMARLQNKKQAAVTTGSAKITRHSLRNGFTGYTYSPR